jgi:molecular chaperone GrpE
MDRDEILRRFTEWLDGAVVSEEPPHGIEAEILAVVTGSEGERREPDSAYSLWSAMTALTQEVKLQGRSFKELNETLGSQANCMADRERDLLVRETERRCRKEALGTLIDLRDRLGRGLDSVRASQAGASKPIQPGWLARMFGPEQQPGADAAAATVAALKKGYELGIERLDQTLEEFQAREIPCQGQAFDPRRMNAVDREESSTVPEGTVIEVYLSGYEWNGELFRPAQVKVACAPVEKDHE